MQELWRDGEGLGHMLPPGRVGEENRKLSEAPLKGAGLCGGFRGASKTSLLHCRPVLTPHFPVRATVVHLGQMAHVLHMLLSTWFGQSPGSWRSCAGLYV